MGRATGQRKVLRITPEGSSTRFETLSGEEPLEVRVGGQALAVTMRTPGDDTDLALGFLVTEGVVRATTDVREARFCDGKDDSGRNTYNVINVTLAPGVAPPQPGVARNFVTTSSCGVCGKASIDSVRTTTAYPVTGDGVVVKAAVLAQLPPALRENQRVFERTGGLHAAGLFDADGNPLCIREDVGRHNAVDKVVGWALRAGRLPLRGTVLLVSGRASFELTQKALMAGIPMLAAVSAPSTLAVELADEGGLTLVGFLRGGSMNVYTGAERIAH